MVQQLKLSPPQDEVTATALTEALAYATTAALMALPDSLFPPPPVQEVEVLQEG